MCGELKIGWWVQLGSIEVLRVSIYKHTIIGGQVNYSTQFLQFERWPVYYKEFHLFIIYLIYFLLFPSPYFCVANSCAVTCCKK